jgi:hypothetical protein
MLLNSNEESLIFSFFLLIKLNFFLSWSSSISFGSFIRFSIFMQTAFVLLTLAQARGYLPLRIYGPVGSAIQQSKCDVSE